MIAVCEPQCKVFSHEKVNSGFLQGLRLAFPQELIRFFGDASHIAALQRILAHDQAHIDNIEYVPIRFRTSADLLRMLGYRRLLSRVFREAQRAGARKIFFLSFNPEILFTIKTLKRKNEFKELQFALVLHGGFESIADNVPGVQSVAPPRRRSPGGATILEKLRRTQVTQLPIKAKQLLARVTAKFISPWSLVSAHWLTEKKLLLWRHSEDFRYICLAPYVRRNASHYLDVDRLNFHAVVLPTAFAPVASRASNEFAKFAMFGYGNSAALHEVLIRLARKHVKKPYEIRVIGMDSRGTEGFANVTCPSPGKPLDRSDMERHARDIDMFLILYEKNRYRLSCSGSILESLSYLKPVLYLDNECVNYFNRDGVPIGIRCDNVDELAQKIQDIAEGYPEFGPRLDRWRENMLAMRKECCIEQSVGALRDSFTW